MLCKLSREAREFGGMCRDVARWSWIGLVRASLCCVTLRTGVLFKPPFSDLANA